MGCGDPGRDHVGEVGAVAGRDRHGRHDPGELHLQLDVAVEVEVPVEAVLVVADGGDEADDQAARPAGLVGAALQVVVLPEDPVVLLVHADRVLDRVRVALLGGEHRVEVVDDAEAVAAQLQRVGHAAEAPLAGVERVLPAVHHARGRRRARPSPRSTPGAAPAARGRRRGTRRCAAPDPRTDRTPPGTTSATSARDGRRPRSSGRRVGRSRAA